MAHKCASPKMEYVFPPISSGGSGWGGGGGGETPSKFDRQFFFHQKLVLGRMVAEWSFNMRNGNYMVFSIVIHDILNGNCMIIECYIIEFTIRFFFL